MATLTLKVQLANALASLALATKLAEDTANSKAWMRRDYEAKLSALRAQLRGAAPRVACSNRVSDEERAERRTYLASLREAAMSR